MSIFRKYKRLEEQKEEKAKKKRLRDKGFKMDSKGKPTEVQRPYVK